MTREPFNADWVYRQFLGPFAAVQGASVVPAPVTLPHDALRDAERAADVPSRRASAYYPPAAYAYLKTLEAPADWAERVVSLEFQGAYRHAMVFVNDQLAGNRADGYARFLVNIKPFLRYGESNEIRVEVRSGQDSRWYSGAGLHRPVFLHVNHPLHIALDGVRITTLDVEPDQAVVEVATSVINEGLNTQTVTLSTTVHGPAGAQVEGDATPVTVAPGETCLVRQRMYVADPGLWSVDNPILYTARSTLGAAGDEVITRFGIRTLQVDPRKGLRINGEPVLLRGACIHNGNGPLGAAAVDRADERRIELLKAAGFNAIRSAHNPLSPAMLDACDRLGMLVMDEAFDMWVRTKSPYDYALDFPQWWAADLESMVAKDYNHPSVIMYSLGNEIVEVGTPHGSRLARQMAEQVRRLDRSRLVTNGAGFEGLPITVEVYADADEVALLLDGAEIARGPVGSTKPMVAELETSYQPGQLEAISGTSPSRFRTPTAPWPPAPTDRSPSRSPAPGCWPGCAAPIARRSNASTHLPGRPSTVGRSRSSDPPASARSPSR